MVGSRMSLARLRLLAALLLALPLTLSACGGGETTSEPGTVAGDAVEFAPADSAMVLLANTDFESGQWQAAQALLDRFPSGDKLISELLSEVEQEGLDWETDIKPALGPEVGLVALSFAATEGEFVGFTKPRDPEKFAQLLTEADDPAVVDEIEGWTVFSDKQANIDRFEQSRKAGSLGDSETFNAATAGLSGDGMITLYLDGESLIESATADDPEAAQGLEMLSGSLGSFRSMALEVVAEENGVRLHGIVGTEGGPVLEAYDAGLPSEVPADAFAYVSFNNLEGALGDALDAIGESTPDFDQQLGLLELGVGLSFTEDLLPLFAGEGAIAVAPGSPLPAISLILDVEDDAAALATVDKLATAAGGFVGGGAKPVATEIEGVQAKQLAVEGVSLFYAGFDGKLVVTTSREGIAGLLEDGPKLADDPGFQAAKEAAGMPDETIGFFYVDLGEAIQLIGDYAQLAGDAIPPDVSENLEPLGSLLAFGARQDESITFTGFLEIE
jgi:hypothetical protein